MKRGEGFTKPPWKGPPPDPGKHPKPKPEPIRREGVRPGESLYEEAPEPSTTEPEAVTPASTEEGLPQTGAGIHEGPPDTLPPPTPRPWRHHWSTGDTICALIVAICFVSALVIYSDPFGSSSPGTSTTPPPSAQEGGGSQQDQEGGVTQQAQEGGGSQQVAVSNHWVSATPGKGFRIWDPDSKGYCWWEGDADLRGGTTGSLTFIYTACNPDLIEVIGSVIGLSWTYNIETWRDNGTTIDFTARHEGAAQVFTARLTRTPDGHLKGSVNAPTTYEETVEGEFGPVEASAGAIEGTLNLAPAP